MLKNTVLKSWLITRKHSQKSPSKGTNLIKERIIDSICFLFVFDALNFIFLKYKRYKIFECTVLTSGCLLQHRAVLVECQI